jgi:hypothetical protein
LQIGRVAVFAEDALNQYFDFGAGDDEVAFYDALSANNSALEVMGKDELKVIAVELVTRVRKSVSIDWTLRESVEAQIDATLSRGAHLFCKLDQFFDDFLRCDRAVMIGVEGLLEHLREFAALN